MRLFACVAGMAAITLMAHHVIGVNATTVGYTYLLVVLVIASAWGFVEAAAASVAATLAYNYFFFPPVGTFIIADPQNWVALFTFLTSSLIASRLSAKARRRAQEAIERQQDVERLYTFSRAILLIDDSEPFPKQLVRKLADTYELTAAVLYERQSGEFFRAGSSDFEGLDEQLREAALGGTAFADPERQRVITAVRLGSEPIASLALQGAPMQDSVLQGIANLVAIGLERARAQSLAHQVEAARQSEQLRTALIDAMAHEFKTPLTLIKAATTSLLAGGGAFAASSREQLEIADSGAEHLRELIDGAVEMARLDAARVEVHRELTDLREIVREVVASFESATDERPFEIVCAERLPRFPLDRRLVKLAVRQLVSNAVKYSPPGTRVTVALSATEEGATIEVTDHGEGIPAAEQGRVFERFFRGASVRRKVPGSGLGLSIAHRVVEAHRGELTLASRPGETTFRIRLPIPEAREEA
jgi:two-component system sensor histidine kinase KdpD